MEISSPGVFPGPFDVNNLTSGVTYIRNTAITKVFREAGYIETLGTGFITMIDAYQAMGLKIPSAIEGEHFVKCILPREKTQEKPPQEIESILRLFNRLDELSIRDVVQTLGISKATAGAFSGQSAPNRLLKKSARASAGCAALPAPYGKSMGRTGLCF